MGWQDAPEVGSSSPAWASAPEVEAKRDGGGTLENLAKGVGRGFNRVVGTIGGAVSGAVDSLVPKSLTDLVLQRGGGIDLYRKQRQQFDSFSKGLEAKGGDTIAFKAGDVGGQVLATLPVGGVLGAGAKAAGASTPIVEALSTGGFKAGGLTGLPGLLTRAAGGAATGAATAGLIDPEQAGAGAAVGAVAPLAVKAIGYAGNALGRVVNGPAVPEATRAGVAAAREAGYVIPPTQARPTLANRLLEGAAGKVTTAQNASARNQEVTNALVKKGLGMSDDAALNPEALQSIRNTAGQAYEAVRGSGIVRADKEFLGEIDKLLSTTAGAERSFPGLAKSDLADKLSMLKQPAFDAGDAVDAIRVLRDSAESAYGKGDKAAGKTYRAASEALEGALDRHLAKSGDAGAVNALRDARKLIAKTYTAQNALNPASGNIEANKLATALKRGKPLSDELKQVAEFAAQFPKASQNVATMGSLPQTSPVDLWGAGLAGSVSGNPLMMGLPLIRPAARAAALSPAVQNRLTASGDNALLNLLAADPALQLGVRAAPVLAADR